MCAICLVSAAIRLRNGIAASLWQMARGAIFAAAAAMAAFVGVAISAASSDPPQESEAIVVLQSYLRATYARDATAAYALVSQADRAVKSSDEHARESGALGPEALELSRTLAELIRFEDTRLVPDGDQLKVIFSVTMPDATAPVVRDIALNFDDRALARLSPAELRARANQLRQMDGEVRLPMLRNDHEEWHLVSEAGSWRVHLNWAGAVEVLLDAVTKDGLPWEFYPLQPRILVRPGETVEAVYRVRNRVDYEITGRARHVIGPSTVAKHLDVVACFCFLEQTLAPGATADLPLTLRVDYDVPDQVRQLTLSYEFFPQVTFPREVTQ